jgi:hypothetical protein
MTDIGVRERIGRLLIILRFDGVRVEVEEGIVYLEGVVETSAHKQLLENVVRHLDGVHAVVNCLALEHIVHWPSFRSNRMRSYQKKEQLSYGY